MLMLMQMQVQMQGGSGKEEEEEKEEGNRVKERGKQSAIHHFQTGITSNSRGGRGAVVLA
jgi:hypothetical protein